MGTVLVLLSIPFIAMFITDEVKWTVFDFVIMGALLTAVGFTIEFILRKIQTNKMRILLTLVVILIFGLVWLELAVGIFNSPIAGS